MTALATTGAGALVGAVATDAWQGARDGIVRLFRRGGPRRQELVGEWLDANADAVEQADPGDRDQLLWT